MTQEVWVCENQTAEDILAKTKISFKTKKIGIGPGSPKWSTTCGLVAKLRSGILPGDYQFPPAQLPRTRQGVLETHIATPTSASLSSCHCTLISSWRTCLFTPSFYLGLSMSQPEWLSLFQPLTSCLVLEDAARDTWFNTEPSPGLACEWSKCLILCFLMIL